MASLDFVYDLVQKFQADNIDYLVVTIRNGKAKDKADIFYRLKDPATASVLRTVIRRFDKDLGKKIKEG